MTIMAIADFFCAHPTLPIPVDSVLEWIRANTDHKMIELHAVRRDHKAFRGGFRRKTIIRPGALPYQEDFDILTQIFYGEDLDDDWKRLVIVKEALHVFDGPNECVTTPEALRQLIPGIITRELQGAPFLPALNDRYGALRAMAVLMPETVRPRLAAAVEEGSRTVEEVAVYTRLPETYVDTWLRFGSEIYPYLVGRAR